MGFSNIALETGDLTEFDSTTSSGSSVIEASTDQAHAGTYSVRIESDGSADVYGDIAVTWSAPDLYVRAQIYIPGDFDIGANWRQVDLFQVMDGASTVMAFGIANFGSGSGPYPGESWVWWNGASANYDTDNYVKDEWVTVEMHFVQNATVGGIVCRINETTEFTDLNDDTSSLEPDTFRIGMDGFNAKPAAGSDFYADNMEGDDDDWLGEFSAGGAAVAPTGTLYGPLWGPLGGVAN